MDLADIYIPPTPEKERDALRAKVNRLLSELAYEKQLHKDAKKEIDRLEAELLFERHLFNLVRFPILED